MIADMVIVPEGFLRLGFYKPIRMKENLVCLFVCFLIFYVPLLKDTYFIIIILFVSKECLGPWEEKKEQEQKATVWPLGLTTW